MATRTGRTVVRIDGEPPYVIQNGNVGHSKAVWEHKNPPTETPTNEVDNASQAKTLNEKPFLGAEDYKQHRKQIKKHWDWKEGQQSSFVDGDIEGRHEAYNRSLATDGRMVGGERANTFGHKLHKGTISRDEEGRSHYSLDNPVKGFSNNVIMKHVLDVEPHIGKNPEEQVAFAVPGGKTVSVRSEELHTHYGEHGYEQPKWV
jgi:hypothetical protein